MNGVGGTVSLEAMNEVNGQTLYIRYWAGWGKAATGGTSFNIIHAGDGKYIFESTYNSYPHRFRAIVTGNPANLMIKYPDTETYYDQTLYTFELI